MGFLGIAFTFLGYLLVYASVAKSGRFAAAPWTAIFADAYDDDAKTAKPPKGPTGPLGAN